MIIDSIWADKIQSWGSKKSNITKARSIKTLFSKIQTKFEPIALSPYKISFPKSTAQIVVFP